MGSTKTRNGTERNRTNGTVVFRRRDQGRTDFCLYVVLHRRYRNVHVAAKVSTYSTEGMHCRTTRRLRTWKYNTRAHAFRSPQNQVWLGFLPRSSQTCIVNQGRFCCLPCTVR